MTIINEWSKFTTMLVGNDKVNKDNRRENVRNELKQYERLNGRSAGSREVICDFRRNKK